MKTERIRSLKRWLAGRWAKSKWKRDGVVYI